MSGYIRGRPKTARRECAVLAAAWARSSGATNFGPGAAGNDTRIGLGNGRGPRTAAVGLAFCR